MQRLQKRLWVRGQTALAWAWVGTALGSSPRGVLTAEGLWEPEQDCTAEEEAGGKGRQQRENSKNPENILREGSADAFTLNELLKTFENTESCTAGFSLIEKNVRGASSAYKQIVMRKQTNKQSSKPPWTDIFLRRVTPPQGEPQAGPSGGSGGQCCHRR